MTDADHNAATPRLEKESPYGDTPSDDVACAWCGAYRTLYGPLNFDGEVVEHGDFVCQPCAEKEGVEIAE